jgi:hypothetical protein
MKHIDRRLMIILTVVGDTAVDASIAANHIIDGAEPSLCYRSDISLLDASHEALPPILTDDKPSISRTTK